MKVIDLTGDAYERGVQQGELVRDDYLRMMETFFSSDLWRNNRPWFLADAVAKPIFAGMGVWRIRDAVRRHLPMQAARIDGIAEGLRIAPSLAWGLHFLEIMFCEAGKSLKVPGGCTQLHAQRNATAGGTPLVGRNYDFPNLLRDFQVVRRDQPSEPGRLVTTTVTQAPLVGCHQGINEAGLTVSANNARMWKGEDFRVDGVPYMLLMQDILETCRTTEEGVERLRGFGFRTNAGFFGFMDESGDCQMVEFTATRSAVRKPGTTGTLAQSNHYHLLTDANLPEGTYWTVEGMEGRTFQSSSGPRFEVADRLLAEKAGEITVETLQSILRDHSHNEGKGSDATICCHGASGSTLSSMVMDIATRTLWIADGKPCESDFVEVALLSS